MLLMSLLYHFQHANEDVERMLLGNKCDMEDKRVVPKAKGEQVRWCTPLTISKCSSSRSLVLIGRLFLPFEALFSSLT